MRKALIFLAVLIALPTGLIAYTKAAARLMPGTPPAMAALDQQATRILVEKSIRRLTLLRGETVLVSYPIVLGAKGDDGPKQAEGDERTPEGLYEIDWRNPKSIAHLSLHISYPNATDALRPNPGGNIMIHGLPNGWGAIGSWHLLADWTDGCIGVDNAAMQDIWSRTPNGTEIEIRP